MYANSSPITSAQTARHENLLALVDRHARSQFLKPILDYNRQAFELSMSAWKQAGEAPLILDAGCGVGLSTLHLAARYPDHFVIGVDQDEYGTTFAGGSAPGADKILSSATKRVTSLLTRQWRAASSRCAPTRSPRA